MKAKNQAKEKQIMMMTQLESGETIICEQFKGHQKAIRAGIDYNYQYVVIGKNSSANNYLSAVVKEDQMLINFLMILTRHNYKYSISKIRRRARKFNPATIS